MSHTDGFDHEIYNLIDLVFRYTSADFLMSYSVYSLSMVFSYFLY